MKDWFRRFSIIGLPGLPLTRADGEPEQPSVLGAGEGLRLERQSCGAHGVHIAGQPYTSARDSILHEDQLPKLLCAIATEF